MLMIVVDNESEETLRLWEYLEVAFPTAQISPDRSAGALPIFQDWSEVHSFIVKFPDERAIICLDLALKSGKVDFKDVERGFDQGAAIRQLRPNWVMIAYTMHGSRAKLFPAYQNAFHGMIDKAFLDSIVDREERIQYVKNMVNAAIKKFESERGTDAFPTSVRIADSLGIRSFHAVFGDAALPEIIENEASRWNSIHVKALTTGHSGAFLLSIQGNLNGRRQSIAVKVARDEHVIQDELEAPSKHIRELGPLNGRLGFFEPKKIRLSTANGVYYRQALENGRPLIELLRTSERAQYQRILGPVVRLCIDTWRTVPSERWGTEIALNQFKLTPIDVSRLETSAVFVKELGDTLVKRNYWPADSGSPSEVTEQLAHLALSWNESTLTQATVRTVLQHGDLNPGNILIREDEDGVPVLIDLSRLGQWPIGYDLARLALMLRLRLMSAHIHEDWFPDSLATWSSESVCRLDRDSDSNDIRCLEAQYCDSQFQRSLEVLDVENQRMIQYGYRLGTLWDLIKIGSYQDISPFKRVWAFIEAWKLKTTLERHMVRDRK
jgi:hypothetical protein